MKINKDIYIRVLYIFILYILYSLLLDKYDYIVKYLTNFLFIIYIFTKFIFGQLDFYAERFRLKDVFINLGINIVFSATLYAFWKRFDIFNMFAMLFLFQVIFRRIVCSIYMKKKNVLIFGSNHIENNIQHDIIKSLDYNYVGYVSDNKNKGTEYLIGSYGELEEIIHQKKIDILIIVKDIKSPDFKRYMKRIFDLKINGLKIMNYEEFNEDIQKKIDVNKINEEWLLQSNGFDILNNEMQRNIKRGMDLMLALILMVILSPFALIVSIIIKLESRGPVIFKQTRIGENMRPFKVYKFRSMRLHDPDKYSKYTLDNDSRVTKFGKFIRKTRIDELPQLWNILKGTMSFVGPRPEWDILAKDYARQINYYNLRHLIKPGITGWAQVMFPYGESLDDAKKKLEYDLYYLKHQDFILDVLIVAKTAKAVFFGKGK